MSNDQDYESQFSEYRVKFRRDGDEEEARPQRRRTSHTSQKASRPSAFNGIHRRRNKKYNW